MTQETSLIDEALDFGLRCEHFLFIREKTNPLLSFEAWLTRRDTLTNPATYEQKGAPL